MAPVKERECSQNRFRSFIVLDLETTGLPYDKPVKITEIAVVAALREHILGYGSDTGEISVPRVLSKLALCVSPRRIIARNAAIISHLTNELLEHQSPFDEHLFNMLDDFMKRMPLPICIIAHNGLRFDFPVLQAELQRIGKAFPDHIMCADSLPGFQKLLPTIAYVKTCNGKPTDVNSTSLLNDIQPLNNDHVLEDQKVTKPAYPEINGLTSELEGSDLHLNDYDEALCSAVDAVETVEVSKCNFRDNVMALCCDDTDDQLCCVAVDTVEGEMTKDGYKVLISDPPEKVKMRNSMGNEGSVCQKAFEVTPPHPISVRGKLPYPTGGNSNDTTPQGKTSGNVAGTRSHLNTSCRARKQLTFLSDKSHNVSRRYRLQDIYRLLLKKEPANSHCAENDALNLLECIVALGQSFTDWVDENAVQFNSIKKMG